MGFSDGIAEEAVQAGDLDTDTLLSLTGQARYEWDIASDQLVWSDNFFSLTGLHNIEAARHGRGFETLLGAESGQSRFAMVFSGTQGHPAGRPVPYQCVFCLNPEHIENGVPVWIEDIGAWIPDGAGRPVTARGVVRVVTDRRSREDMLRRRSDHDDLTGLANRRFIEFKVGEALEECAKDNSRAVLMLVCIERMDLINDFYGFGVGDEILRIAGEMLAKKLRADDLIARFSGAKFAILLRNCSGSEVYSASRRFVETLSRNLVKTSKGPVSLSATIGACQLPRHARTIKEAVAACFSAAARARQDKKQRIAVHDCDPEKIGRAREDAEIATKVIESLEKGKMRLAFQPVVEARSGRIAFHEALVRIEDDDGSIIGASTFLPIAEKLGFMRVIDGNALDLALDTLQTFPQARLSINVSNASAEDADWLSKLASRLQAAPTLASRLIVEITESHAASDLAESQKFVSILRSVGCQVAVDDFGAGYTSFANLKSLPVDIIKIDGSFAKDLANNQQNQVFIRCLLDLARAFDAKTVVEWVEDPETAALLSQWGVDYLQGHCFGAASLACPWFLDDTAPVSGSSTPDLQATG